MLRIMLSFALAAWTGSLARAQGPTPVVQANLVMATDAAHANSSVKVAVVANVSPGYHINDHKPTLDYLIPTELKLDPLKQVSVKDVIYPKGELKKFAFSDGPLSVYEGTVVIGSLLQVARAVPPGAYTLKGKFAYQACNDHACLPPASLPLTLTLKVVARNVRLRHVNSDVFERIQIE
jgi:DsbC/DsbD-like thiol-disulfide interchange protein